MITARVLLFVLANCPSLFARTAATRADDTAGRELAFEAASIRESSGHFMEGEGSESSGSRLTLKAYSTFP